LILILKIGTKEPVIANGYDFQAESWVLGELKPMELT
jgi:hypothetical protein